jgi:hypothetical protein
MKKALLFLCMLPFCSCVIVKFPDTVQVDIDAKDLEFLQGRPQFIEFGRHRVPMQLHIEKEIENDTLPNAPF